MFAALYSREKQRREDFYVATSGRNTRIPLVLGPASWVFTCLLSEVADTYGCPVVQLCKPGQRSKSSGLERWLNLPEDQGSIPITHIVVHNLL